MVRVLLLLIGVFFLELVYMSWGGLDWASLLIWCLIVSNVSSSRLWVVVVMSMMVSVVSGDRLGILSAIFVFWWCLLVVYRKKYRFLHYAMVGLITYLVSLSIGYFREGLILYLHGLAWVCAVWLWRWLVVDDGRDLRLKY